MLVWSSLRQALSIPFTSSHFLLLIRCHVVCFVGWKSSQKRWEEIEKKRNWKRDEKQKKSEPIFFYCNTTSSLVGWMLSLLPIFLGLRWHVFHLEDTPHAFFSASAIVSRSNQWNLPVCLVSACVLNSSNLLFLLACINLSSFILLCVCHSRDLGIECVYNMCDNKAPEEASII